jgi:hypothetical protein
VRPRGRGAARQPRLVILRAVRTRKSERFCHDTALRCLRDVSADEVR